MTGYSTTTKLASCSRIGVCMSSSRYGDFGSYIIKKTFFEMLKIINISLDIEKHCCRIKIPLGVY